MSEEIKTLDALVQEKMDADADFQSEIADLSEEEKVAKEDEKKQEIISSSWEELNETFKKSQENYINQKKRAEKAEATAKKPKGEPTPKNNEQEFDGGLSPKDYLALTETGIKSDEFDRVVELSTLLKKPVSETLKDKTALSILKTEREERQTADVVSTNAKARKGHKTGKELVLDKFTKGELPTTEEDGAKLAEAQFEQIINKGN